MRESSHPETLELIRRIAEDGILDTDEIWELVGFLNGNKTARHSWPGNVLWETLESMFDDGVLSNEEIEALGHILTDIEHEWRARQQKNNAKA
jgi:hypothetical protein